MVKMQNDCCGCATPLYPCRGDICSLRHVPHFFCDKCGAEIDMENESLYDYGGDELCEDCLLESVPKVRPHDY